MGKKARLFLILKYANLLTANPLIIQKFIYLLIQRGVKLPYEFIWSTKGPYSAKLADHIAEVKENKEEFHSSLKNVDIGAKTKQEIDRLLRYLGEEIYSRTSMEALASIVFLKKDRGIQNPRAVLENYSLRKRSREHLEVAKRFVFLLNSF